MATQTIDIPVAKVGPGGASSGSTPLPANTQEIDIQVVSPDWFTTTGTVTYRIEVLVAGAWVNAAESSITMGWPGKNGGTSMPIIGIAADILGQATAARIWAACNPRISIGGTATIISAG